MIVILFLSSESEISLISIPSITMLPYSISTILLRAKLIVLLPAPVLPTIPIFLPGSMLKSKPFRTSSVFGL